MHSDSRNTNDSNIWISDITVVASVFLDAIHVLNYAIVYIRSDLVLYYYFGFWANTYICTCVWFYVLCLNHHDDLMFALRQLCFHYYVMIICIATLVGARGLEPIREILDLCHVIWQNVLLHANDYWRRRKKITANLICRKYFIFVLA